MTDIVGTEYPVLDHGFVRVVDTMGSDEAIVQAARVSYGSGTEKKSTDRGLIRYLMRHWHSTPFEMCEIKLHVKLPIFVARQWIRHRTANVNEYSARYSILDREFYIPEIDLIQPQSKTNKQGRAGELPEAVRFAMRETIRQQSEGAYQVYEELRTGSPWFHRDGQPIDYEHDDFEPFNDVEWGMAREMARMVLPPNVYTQWYWKVDLHNLFHFMRLRADSHAQYEIRVYAEAICKAVQAWCPVAYEAFEDYRMKAVMLSRQEADIMCLLASRNAGAFRRMVEEDQTMGESERKALLDTFLPEGHSMTTLDRLYGVLDACFETSGKRSPEVPVSAFTDDSLVMLEFVLLIEDEFGLDLNGYGDITTESTMGEIAAQLDGLMGN